ncbi:MAG: cation diffusion facilitator family transporter [Solirubrobacterales bacterium]
MHLTAPAYELVNGDRHRHGELLEHSHPHTGPHDHESKPTDRKRRPHSHASPHSHDHGSHGHTHGLVDESIKRSREGIRAVSIALGILVFTAGIQIAIFGLTGSMALLADLIHNVGDAATAFPLGIAFLMRSERAERFAGLAVVFAIVVSACVAGAESVSRLINPQEVTDLFVLAIAGFVGFGGNWIAGIVRQRAGERLNSPALIADAAHARADSYVSLAVVAGAAFVAAGIQIADPLIGLAITLVILRIAWQSWLTVSRSPLAP